MKQQFAAISSLFALSIFGASPAFADHHEASQQATDAWAGFRASGNEPFWSLRFDETQMAFEHFGVIEAEAPRAAAQITLNGTIFMGRSEEGERRDFIVLVESSICSDSMSGRPYPYSVRVFVEGLHFSGCGGDTQELLSGGDWTVTSLGGSPVPESAEQNFRFDGTDGITGSGGCNRFTGTYALTEGITFGPIASTRRACINPEISRLESRLFTTLASVINFEIAEGGVLTLFDESGPVLTAQR